MRGGGGLGNLVVDPPGEGRRFSAQIR